MALECHICFHRERKVKSVNVQQQKRNMRKAKGTDIQKLSERKNAKKFRALETPEENKQVAGSDDDTDVCMFCGKEVPIFQLRIHEDAHKEEEKLRAKEQRRRDRFKSGDAVCSVCGKTIPYKQLKKHERLHRRMEPKVCTICGFFAKNLYNHMASHSNERKHECSECGMTFKLRKNLYSHRLVHTSVGKHKCPTCGKAFKLPYSLKVHMRSHLEVKPFPCQVCHKTFTTKQSRDIHLKTHL